MHQDLNRKNIIAKIKLLANIVNPESGAFPGEIAAASIKMQELMDKYQISMAEILLSPSEHSRTSTEQFTEASCIGILGSLKSWHWRLGRVIARLTGTRHFSKSAFGPTLRNPKRRTMGSRMSFFGTPETCQLAADLFDEWVVLIDDMGKKATSAYVKKLTLKYAFEMELQDVQQVRHLAGLGSEHPNVWRNSWLLGVTYGIEMEMSKHEKERTQETSRAIIIINDRVEGAFLDFSRDFAARGGTNAYLNRSALESGIDVGKDIRIGSKRIAK